MKKLVLVCCLLLPTMLGASDQHDQYPGLFATVIDVAKGDTLNVRDKPSTHHSKVVSRYEPDATVMIDLCGTFGQATWCNVHTDNAVSGWVNARYLKFHDKGYVSIAKRKSICDYSLKCEIQDGKKRCLVATDIGEHDDIQLKTEWIDRQYLNAETNFTAADDPDLNPEGGYCTQGNMIEDYLGKNPIQ